MKKVELKTKNGAGKVSDFLKSIQDPGQLADSKVLIEMMKKITGKKPVMWGDSIVGFDSYTYHRSNGAEGEWFIVGFSPRKNTMNIYVICGYENDADLLEKLGPSKNGKSCLVIKNLDSIHLPTLKKIITKGYKEMKKQQK